jgi:hypothetical protein
MAKKKINVDQTNNYKVLKPFMAEKQYLIGQIYKTSKNVEYLKINKYIK